jgi:PAS domain S-box-containing protein
MDNLFDNSSDKTAEILRESEERYRTLFSSMDEGFCVCEMILDDAGKPYDYRFLEVNPTFEKQTGLENAMGKTARQLVPNLEQRWFEIYGRVALTGETVRFIDGSDVMNRWFDVYAFRVGAPEERKFAILFKDITARKRLERERERFLAVGSDLQVINGTEGYFKWVSPAWERTFGWTVEEMTTRPWTDFLHPDDYAKTIKEAENAYRGAETLSFENRYLCKDGSYRWLNWRAQTYAEENLIYAVATDITESKRAEENQKLLFEIAEKIRQAENADDLLFAVSEAVGEHLQVRRCLFNEIDLETDRETVHRDYCRGARSVAGVHPISEYSPVTSAEMEAGRTVINRDSQTDSRTAEFYEQTYAPTGERAYIAVPLGCFALGERRPPAQLERAGNRLARSNCRTRLAGCRTTPK